MIESFHNFVPNVYALAFLRICSSAPDRVLVYHVYISDTSEAGIRKTRELGLMPAVSWLAKPSLVKRLQPGRKVGYDQTYK